jgi:hypothetical protein
VVATVTWLLILAVVAALAVLMYRIHKGKQSPRTSYHVTTPTMHVSVPSDIPKDEGDILAHKLEAARFEVWRKLIKIYGETPRDYVIRTLYLVHGNAAEGHPYVVWYAPSHIVRLSIRDDMLRWWVLEVHNAFRYAVYGMERIYLGSTSAPPSILSHVR